MQYHDTDEPGQPFCVCQVVKYASVCLHIEKMKLRKKTKLKEKKTVQAKDGSPSTYCIEDVFPLIKDYASQGRIYFI